MRSNIKYQHSDASYQLNRYQERVRELEAINESLLQNNTKLGRYLHEINDCHREKARILHNSIQELEGKLAQQDTENKALRAELEAIKGSQASQSEQYIRQTKALNEANAKLKEDTARLSDISSKLSTQNSQLKQEQEQMALKYYQSVFELDCWSAKWAASEEEREAVQELSRQYENQIVRMREQLRESGVSDLQAVSSSSEECRVLNDIINIGTSVGSPGKRALRQQ